MVVTQILFSIAFSILIKHGIFSRFHFLNGFHFLNISVHDQDGFWSFYYKKNFLETFLEKKSMESHKLCGIN